MAAANKKQERISAVRFVHYFSDKHPHGTLAVSGENFYRNILQIDSM